MMIQIFASNNYQTILEEIETKITEIQVERAHLTHQTDTRHQMDMSKWIDSSFIYKIFHAPPMYQSSPVYKHDEYLRLLELKYRINWAQQHRIPVFLDDVDLQTIRYS